MIALLDADILCYRVAATTEDEPEGYALTTMATSLEDLMLFDLEDVYEFELYLTGKNNFRYEIAKTAPYKGNRVDKPRPKHLPALREYVKWAFGAVETDGQEADDAIAIRATELGVDECVIVSIDKDFLQVPGWHYNFNKREKTWVTPEQGLRFFYSQVLTGDIADNVKGAPGIGPKKAEKILADAKTEYDLYQSCVEVMGEERVLEDARLLWLRRYENQMWEPPNETV